MNVYETRDYEVKEISFAQMKRIMDRQKKQQLKKTKKDKS